MNEKLLTVRETAELLSVHPKTVYAWAKAGRLPATTLGRAVRLDAEAVRSFIDNRSPRFVDPAALTTRIALDLDNFDRLHLRLGPKGGKSAVNERTRRRWNYGFGSVYLRPTRGGADRWAIDYMARGKRVREVVKDAQSRAEAVVALQVRMTETFSGRFHPERKADAMTFARLADTYLEDYAKANKRSWRCDEYALRATLVPHFGRMTLGEITPLVVERYRSARLLKVRKSSTNREMALLKTMFNRAIDWGYATANPIRKVRLFSERDNLKERILTDDEERRLMDAATPDLRPYLVALLNTCARRMEILRLRWRDVDLERDTIMLRHTKAGRDRMIPINATLRDVLLALKAKRRGEYVFPNLGPEETNGVRRAFEGACRRAGLKGLRIHDLRHTGATRLVRRGVDIMTVKELLGHSSVVVTQRYVHQGEDAKREAVRRLESTGELARVRHTDAAPADETPANLSFSVN